MLIWPLATVPYAQLKSDLTAKCLNIDCKTFSQFMFESLRKFWKRRGEINGPRHWQEPCRHGYGLGKGDLIN